MNNFSWQYFLLRLKTAYRILFKPKRMWFFFETSNDQLHQLLENQSFEIDIKYYRSQPYIVQLFLNRCAKTPDEMILMKAEFEAEAHLHQQSKRQVV